MHIIETLNKLIRISRRLVQELGREPTPTEIGKRMDIPAAKVRKVLGNASLLENMYLVDVPELARGRPSDAPR